MSVGAPSFCEHEARLNALYEVPWEDYARSIHLFLSGLGTGVDVDFTGHKLVGIGHSMGAVSLCVGSNRRWDINNDHNAGDFRAVITPRSDTPR